MNLAVSAQLSPPQNELFHQKLAAVGLESSPKPEPELVYLCGLPASRLLDRYEPLAAPLLAAERYRGQPWYFVDVIGREGHQADQRWAFNEKSSFSGWTAVQHGFALERRSFDGVEWLETGSHLDSVKAVRSGAADRAGIDSMILDLQPELLDGLERVNSWGPWPAPPVMVARSLSSGVVRQLREAFASDVGGQWLALESDHLDPIIAVANGARTRG